MNVDVFKKSFNQWTKNLIVFVPDLAFIAFTYLLLYVINAYTGIGEIFSLMQSGGGSLEILKEYFSDNVVSILTSVVVFVVTTFFFGVSVLALKFEMIKNVIRGKKASLIKSYKVSHKNFWQIVLMKLFVFFLSLVIVIFITLVSGLVYFIVSQFNVELAKFLTLLISVILILLSIFVLKLGILFRYPVLFLSKKIKAWSALLKSINYFRKDPVYVFVTWLFIILLSIVIWIFTGIVNYILSLIQGLSSNTIFVLVTLILISLFGVLLNLVAEIWGTFILFDRYKN